LGRDGLAVVSDPGNSELTGRSAMSAPASLPQGSNADDVAPSDAKATLLVSYWFLSTETAMAASLTLKNIPDEIYDRLKEAAQAHHRSLNSEVIACLEQALVPLRISPGEHLARARRIREGLQPGQFKADEIAEAIDQGRP